MKHILNIFLVVLCATLFLGIAQAQSPRTLVTFNGVKITSAQLDQWVSVAVSEGAKDTPELRQGILNDLVLREAISQEVKKTGLLSRGNNAFKVKLAEQNAVVDIWFAQYFAEHPVTNEEVRAVYDKQVELSKDPKNAKEYLVAQIVVPSEADGVALINQLNSGASFEALAKSQSLDKNSGQQGGVIGWVLPTQLTPPVNDIAPNLAKGKVTQSPVKTANGWHVIKVDDVRPFVMPSFDQARNALTQSLVQQRRQEAVNSLTQGFKINQAK